MCAGRDGEPTDQLNVTIRGRKKQEISSTGHKTTLERQFSSYADASRKRQPMPNKSKKVPSFQSEDALYLFCAFFFLSVWVYVRV